VLYDRSVYDNAMLPLAFSGHAPKEAARRVRAALDKSGCSARALEPDPALRRRAAAPRDRARGGEPPSLLIADEPTANLDAESAARILEIFVAFNQSASRAHRHP